MENFTIYNPVKLHFGRDAEKNLPESLSAYGKKVLFLYGKKSIKETGLYLNLKELLSDFELIEYGGIKSNPVIEDVRNAAALAAREEVDVILAVGGGSVVDTAKIVSVAIHYKGDAWDIMKNKVQVQKATPVLAVLTLAATGTEMNPYAVIQNHATQEKIGWGCPLTYPAESFLNPQLTLTVPQNYTAYGLADMIAHSLESFFGAGEAPLSDAMAVATIKEVIEAGLPLLKDLSNYELRARVMYAGTVALNGTLTYGKLYADWGVHDLGHILSLLYDIPHGATLTIAYPAWMKLMLPKLEHKIKYLGRNIFGTNDAADTIKAFEELFAEMGCPVKLEEQIANAGDKKAEILALFLKNKVDGLEHKLSDDDRRRVLDFMFEG